MADIILQARDLCKSFSSEGVQNHVLNNMDLDIYKGDFTVIMGASGSGKSTLLYSLSGMDRPTSGKVIYDGEDITEYNEKRMAELRVYEFGFVFQQIHLVSNLSIRENILVPGYMNKDTSTKETENRADELIKKMNIESAADRLPAQVSGGEAQRVKLATELSKHSTGRTAYILDEPTTGLHSYDVDKLLSILERLRDAGNTVIVIEHNLDVIKVADYIVDLGPEGGDGGGTIIASGTPEEVAKVKESYTGQFLDKILNGGNNE